MSGEPYRLAALLALREAAVARAQEDLAGRLAALYRSRAELEQAGRDLEICRCRRRDAESGGEIAARAAGGHQAADRHRGRRRALEAAASAAVDVTLARVERERVSVEAGRAALATAEKERQALAEHRERWTRERTRMRQAAEESESEDTGQARLNWLSTGQRGS